MTNVFQLVDVFGDGPFTGNPVAVFDGEGLSTDAMQQIARWMNLSETTFLLPPTTREADYRLRIFTLERELPFAGHPTLGTCHAWVERTGAQKDRVIQQCEAGLVPVARRSGLWAFDAPPLVRSGPVDEEFVVEVAQFLNVEGDRIIDAQWCDNGPGWVGVLLSSADEVLALKPGKTYPGKPYIGVIGPHEQGSDVRYEIRTFFSNHLGAIVEDPVTGSFQASVAEWMIRSGRAKTPYVTAQGTAIGRRGRVHVETEGDALWIGGRTETLAHGEAPFEAVG